MPFGQTFSPDDLWSVFFLVILEGLLSADNALVLAIMVRHLPKDQQQRALLYGLGGAFVFRLIAIVFAAVVLQQWWLQAVGAAYLLFLPIKHFLSHGGGAKVRAAGASFWRTVLAVELTDIAFALDSVLAGIAFITIPGEGVQQDKIWVVYTGAMLGIVLLRFAAGLFVRLLERYPHLDHVAYLLVGWVGLKLAFHALEKFQKTQPGVLPFHVPHMTEAFFWSGLATIAIVGGVLAVRNAKARPGLAQEAAVLDDVQDLHISEDKRPGPGPS